MRLTKLIQTQTLENARAKFALGSKQAIAKREAAEISDRIRVAILGAENIAAAEQWTRKVPNDLINLNKAKNYSNYMYITIQPLKGECQNIGLVLTKESIIPWSRAVVDAKKDPELAEQVSALLLARKRALKKVEQYEKDEKDTLDRINSMMRPHGTIESLRKVWPEVDELLPTTIMSPVVVADNAEINKALGLGGKDE